MKNKNLRFLAISIAFLLIAYAGILLLYSTRVQPYGLEEWSPRSLAVDIVDLHIRSMIFKSQKKNANSLEDLLAVDRSDGFKTSFWPSTFNKIIGKVVYIKDGKMMHRSSAVTSHIKFEANEDSGGFSTLHIENMPNIVCRNTFEIFFTAEELMTKFEKRETKFILNGKIVLVIKPTPAGSFLPHEFPVKVIEKLCKNDDSQLTIVGF